MVSNFVPGDVQPERVFEVPAEYAETLDGGQVKEFLDADAPYVDEIPIILDTTSIMQSKAERISTRSGPVLIRRRVTKTKLYRADGREAVVAASNRNRLLNKRDKSGNRVFFTSPPMQLPENEEICEYCFKPFRPDSVRERMDNADNQRALTDEQKRLLEKSGISLERGVNNARYKKAMHLMAQHRRIAAFNRHPLYLEYVEGEALLGDEPPTVVKRGRGRPRKVV